jgi:hypothetical protein
MEKIVCAEALASIVPLPKELRNRKVRIIVSSDKRENAKEDKDDGSLSFLFRNYRDDGIREPLTDFGEPVGAERW